MSGHVIRRLGPVCLLSVVITGCAATHQQRIAMLEEINKHLTERLNEAQAEFALANQEQADLDARLIAALDDPDWRTRARAVRALEAIADPRGQKAIAERGGAASIRQGPTAPSEARDM